MSFLLLEGLAHSSAPLNLQHSFYRFPLSRPERLGYGSATDARLLRAALASSAFSTGHRAAPRGDQAGRPFYMLYLHGDRRSRLPPRRALSGVL
eukprot:4004981-Pyramimonas_sp.AAC.1